MTRFKRFRAAGAFAAVIAAVGTPSRAGATSETEAEAPISVPTAELRLVGGTGLGVEAAGSLLNHRLRVDTGLHGWIKGTLAEGAALARLVGPASNALWVRGGFLFQSIDYSCGITDNVSAWDAGLAYRKRWAGGSLFAAEGGVEYVSRDHGIYCNDSVVPGASGGLRLAVGGQVALTRWLGIYGRAGVRTGSHLMEIGFLPELWAGLAFEI